MKALFIALVLVFTVSVASAQSNKTTKDGKKECVVKKECCKEKKDAKCCKEGQKEGKYCKEGKKGICENSEKKCCKDKK